MNKDMCVACDDGILNIRVGAIIMKDGKILMVGNERSNWHCSNEHFTVEEFIRANCEYPGDWDGEVEKTVMTDDMIITATRVYPKDRSASFHVTSFIKLKDDKIVAMDEYWADDGEAPKWRQDMKIERKIR